MTAVALSRKAHGCCLTCHAQLNLDDPNALWLLPFNNSSNSTALGRRLHSLLPEPRLDPQVPWTGTARKSRRLMQSGSSPAGKGNGKGSGTNGKQASLFVGPISISDNSSIVLSYVTLIDLSVANR